MSERIETLAQVLALVRADLKRGGIDQPALEARMLLGHVTGLDGAALIARDRMVLPADVRERLYALVARRLKGEPVARLLGRQEFYGLDFALGPDTLVPRPETEMLVDLGLEILAGRPDGRFADLGTGSGAICVALAKSVPGAHGVAIDVSADALAIAHENAKHHGVAVRLAFRQADWFAGLAPGERFDVIVSNPPYIESAAMAGLMPEVRDFDPARALDGGADGLDAYRIIIAGAGAHLRPGGVLGLELGAGQWPAVRELLQGAGFSAEARRDLAGIERVGIGRL